MRITTICLDNYVMCWKTISSSKFVSFDTESDIQDNLTMRCTIIQLYTCNDAFIYFTQDKITQYEDYLKSLFNNGNIVKVGYGISQDVIKLGNHGININPTSCIDLQSILGRIALDKLVLDKYKFKMPKISYGTMPRSEEILRYASFDVYFIYLIYQDLTDIINSSYTSKEHIPVIEDNIIKLSEDERYIMEYNYEKIYDIMTKFQPSQYNVASVLSAMQFLCGDENLAKYICLNWKTEKDNLLSKCRDNDKYLIEHFREKCNDMKFKEIKNLVSDYCCKNKYLCDINIVSILLHNLK